MALRALIQKCSPIIAVSVDGTQPLDPQTRRQLERPLSYTYVKFLFGQDAINPITGHKQTIDSELRRLYTYDDQGRFCCQKGFQPKVTKILQDLGYEVFAVDHDPPVAERQRPRCYDEHWDRLLSKFQFRPLQMECVYQIAIHDYGVIDAITAFGKAWIIAMICVLYPYAKIDIITKRTEIVAGLRRLLQRFVPGVGQVGDGKRKVGRVTVYTADSLHKSDFTADIVLCDEVHELMTDRYAALLGRYWYARMYGFTASKETRSDNAHERMEGMFGPTIFYLDYPTGQALGLVVPIMVQWLNTFSEINPVMNAHTLVEEKRLGIWRNERRNYVFAQAARAMHEAGMQVLLLTETVEHVLYLKRYLPEAEACYSENWMAMERGNGDANSRYAELVQAGLLDPRDPMTATKRENLRLAFEERRLTFAVANSVWSTGVSFDSLEVLGRCDAGASETMNIQQPGRVARIDPETGKQCGIVLDGDDSFDTKWAGRAVDRKRSYASRGWTNILPDGKIWIPGRRGRRVEL